jgi:hypothetical protein
MSHPHLTIHSGEGRRSRPEPDCESAQIMDDTGFWLVVDEANKIEPLEFRAEASIRALVSADVGMKARLQNAVLRRVR